MTQLNRRRADRPVFSLIAIAAFVVCGGANAEGVTLLHVGDQESWLLSAQGNLRDDPSQGISFYGGIDRLATVMGNAASAATTAGRSVLKLNAGDAWLPGPRWNASFANLGTAAADGGQDFYDAIALRHIGFDAIVFGNHEFDQGAAIAARFAQVSGTNYVSSNLDFSASPEFAGLSNVKPYTLVNTTGGKTIALVGATTPRLPTISSPGSVGLLNFNPAATEQANLLALASTIQTNVNAARAAGATTVVLMSHLQNWNNEKNTVIPNLTGVDIVLSGGGHELMADADDTLIPGDTRAIAGMPQFVTDGAGKQVAVVTSNFGNRYVGELNFTIDDTTGAVTSIDSSRMLRVSGRAADADSVTGDSFLKGAVVDPVKAYVDVLNSTTIGSSEVLLNGARGTVGGAPGSFIAGVRNSETNLGNVVADAMRFAGESTVAIQNGGGIRASIAAGNVTVGNTFDVLPFTNIVKRANAVSAMQLKGVMEHSVSAVSPSGGADGRFAQVSGMNVVYDTRRAVGDRVRSITLEDGTVLVADGVVVDAATRVSLATVDFTANGGDGYPFAALGIVFENPTASVTYQEALASYIQAPLSEGGLDGLITAAQYGVSDPLDFQGRLVDIAIAVPEPETYALMLGGLALIGWAARRRTARPAPAAVDPVH